MNRRLILLISGKRCSGKDIVANILVGKLLERGNISSSEIRHFAYYPKLDYSNMSGANLNRLLNDRDYKELHRPGILKVANEKRDIYPEVWANMLYDDINSKIVIVPDHRFKPEYEYLKDKDNLRVLRLRIETDEKVRSDRGWIYNSDIDEHASEIDLDNEPMDYMIENNDSIDELTIKLNKVVDDIKIL